MVLKDLLAVGETAETERVETVPQQPQARLGNGDIGEGEVLRLEGDPQGSLREGATAAAFELLSWGRSSRAPAGLPTASEPWFGPRRHPPVGHRGILTE